MYDDAAETDFSQAQYFLALEAKLGKSSVFQLAKMEGHILVGLSSVQLADKLIVEGLDIEETTLRAFPLMKRDERIVIGHDADVSQRLAHHALPHTASRRANCAASASLRTLTLCLDQLLNRESEETITYDGDEPAAHFFSQLESQPNFHNLEPARQARKALSSLRGEPRKIAQDLALLNKTYEEVKESLCAVYPRRPSFTLQEFYELKCTSMAEIETYYKNKGITPALKLPNNDHRARAEHLPPPWTRPHHILAVTVADNTGTHSVSSEGPTSGLFGPLHLRSTASSNPKDRLGLQVSTRPQQRRAREKPSNASFGSRTPLKLNEPTCTLNQHTPVISLRPYRTPYAYQKEIQDQISQLLKHDIITPSSSPYSSPVTLVRKRDNTMRLCIDFRRVNELVPSDLHPLPLIETVYCDASTQGIAGVLKQVHPDGNIYPVQYYSRALRSYERNYTISELECLAIVECVDKFRVYLLGTRFVIYSDHHALQWLKTIKDPTGRLFRWSLRLSAYDYEVKYLKGSRQYEADLLSRNPFCGFLSTGQIKDHQGELRRDTRYILNDKDLVTIIRRGVTKIIVPPSLRGTLLQRAHRDFNHPGISQMTRLIAAQYYWDGMTNDIRTHIAVLYVEADASILNGVRQGCLLSIGIGSLLRRLERILGRGSMVAYADEIQELRLWCGSWKHWTDSPLGISWTSESLSVLGCTITARNTVASKASHLMGLLEQSIARWSPFTSGLSMKQKKAVRPRQGKVGSYNIRPVLFRRVERGLRSSPIHDGAGTDAGKAKLADKDIRPGKEQKDSEKSPTCQQNDEDVVTALWAYFWVVSLTHETVSSGGYTWTTGKREAFVFMHEGRKLYQVIAEEVIREDEWVHREFYITESYRATSGLKPLKTLLIFWTGPLSSTPSSSLKPPTCLRGFPVMEVGLEAETLDADYYWLLEIGRALRVPLYRSGASTVSNAQRNPVEVENLRRTVFNFCSPERINGFLKGATKGITLENSDPLSLRRYLFDAIMYLTGSKSALPSTKQNWSNVVAADLTLASSYGRLLLLIAVTELLFAISVDKVAWLRWIPPSSILQNFKGFNVGILPLSIAEKTDNAHRVTARPKEREKQLLFDYLKLKKTPAKFIPKFLTNEQNLCRLATCEDMLEMIRTDPEWKDKIITGDETWVYGYDPETKRQSAEWRGQDIAPNDFFLFPKLKAVLKGRHFDTRDDIIEKSPLALKSIPKEDYKNCLDNWEKRWRCPGTYGTYLVYHHADLKRLRG
ncbi:K02A2.6-like [Cordylochernes scorpioides]|uniref:RNA-directed DNA polymerase n=1 Tax=Cordylochernes scorpioides TaxID=51811 RepID=A0ABY6L6J0_9ARAC|nr:K02A2.6-like [Cordylochernes scorpioides]